MVGGASLQTQFHSLTILLKYEASKVEGVRKLKGLLSLVISLVHNSERHLFIKKRSNPEVQDLGKVGVSVAKSAAFCTTSRLCMCVKSILLQVSAPVPPENSE